MKETRIIFMGTPGFAVATLEKLIEEGKNIVAVITSPDKPAGRGRKLKQSAVKEFALLHNIPVLQPVNLKDKSFLKELKSYDATLQIVVAFRMLPRAVWEMPSHGTFNLHASLLPNYRGAAPINWAIINQEKTSGVTTFFIDEKIDTGAIILQKEIPVSKNETAGSLHDKLMTLGSDLVLETVQLIEENKAIPKPQCNSHKTNPAPKLTPDNTKIDWNQPTEKIHAFVRGLSPFPGAWSTLVNKEDSLKAILYSGSVIEEKHTLKPGTIKTSKTQLKIATADGFFNCIEIKLAGKRKMKAKDLLNGYNIDALAKMM